MVPTRGVSWASKLEGAPLERASLSLDRLTHIDSFPGLIPIERSSLSMGTTAPAPSPSPSSGQRGCSSPTTAIRHSLMVRGSCIVSPSYHHAQTIPGITNPPCSSLCILEPGFHQCPLTRTAFVSFVDQSVIS